MKSGLSLLLFMSSFTLSQSIFLISAIAQVTPDGTTNTTVNISGNNFTINRGDRAGGNLFHSFSEFSIFNGNEALFNNARDIVNIFSRVTGGKISNIDGLIRANGIANLFFINPAGIIFGENARLNIGGSFYGSTADSIVFSDGEFSATNLDNSPLITINAPIGFNFRDNPTSITVTGNTGLRVNSRQSFNLIGGEINLNSGIISAPEAQIELIGLSQASIIEIDTESNLNISESLQRADINLNNFILESFTVGDESAGNIKITARSLSLSNGSILDSGTSARGNGGNITINSSDSVFIQDASQIISNTQGEGNAGHINIIANNNILLKGINNQSIIPTDTEAPVNPDQPVFTGIFSSANLTSGTNARELGRAGDISIEANDISVNNGARIDSSTFGRRNAGDLTLKANSINLDGDNSSIFSNVGNLELNAERQEGLTGNGGLIHIETQTLSLSDGATINSLTFGEGSAGQIKINAADSINISGVSSFPFLADGITEGGFSSGLFTSTEAGATGSGGEIVLTTPRLQMNDGAIINARSRSNFSAGNVTVNANLLEVNSGSQILTTALSNGTAGNINLNISEQISITGIDPSFFERFNSVAEQFGVERAAFTIDPISSVSGIFANSPNISASSGGNITIVTEDLTLSDQGLISATSNSQVGGNIDIDARFIIAFPSVEDGSDIIAQGGTQGGNITINAQQILNLEERNAVPGNGTNDIDASSEFGLDGNILINTPDVNALQNVTELSGDVVKPEQTITQACQSSAATDVSGGLVIKGKGGVPRNPTEIFHGEILLEEDDLTTENDHSYYPEIQPIETSIGDIYPARGIIKTEDGQIILTAYPTDNIKSRTPYISANCTVNK
ncbi:MAG: filamentous hemagglutinin N-terminal domain-containing protein [Xenococcus sp. (in: cyanobacteria)]